MSVAGVLSCLFRQADDRIGVDVDQASGLSDAAAFGEVLEHGAGIWFGQVSLEQGRALALGEAVFAGRTVEQADGVVPAISARRPRGFRRCVGRRGRNRVSGNRSA